MIDQAIEKDPAKRRGQQNYIPSRMISPPIRYDGFRHTMTLQRFPEEFRSNLLVPLLRDEASERFALVVDSPKR